jgi:hypothetical protein
MTRTSLGNAGVLAQWDMDLLNLELIYCSEQVSYSIAESLRIEFTRFFQMDIRSP